MAAPLWMSLPGAINRAKWKYSLCGQPASPFHRVSTAMRSSDLLAVTTLELRLALPPEAPPTDRTVTLAASDEVDYGLARFVRLDGKRLKHLMPQTGARECRINVSDGRGTQVSQSRRPRDLASLRRLTADAGQSAAAPRAPAGGKSEWQEQLSTQPG